MLIPVGESDPDVRSALLSKREDPEFFYYFCDGGLSGENQEEPYYHLAFKSSMYGADIVGYLGANVDRDTWSVTEVQAIRLMSWRPVTFSRDFRSFLNLLVYERNFQRIAWSVVVGNPAEKLYDKLVDRYGARVIGYERRSVRLHDGRLYDRKLYEFLNDSNAGKGA